MTTISERRTVIVTGIAGNLGTRLLPLLNEFEVIGLDLRPPSQPPQFRFEPIDLAEESSCRQLVTLLKETRAIAIVHLAFVIDPQRTGVLDVERMWQINVAGTARVMEAISVVNRYGGNVRKFIFPSSVSAYGPETSGPIAEDFPLGAHTLPYAIHKQQSDEVVRYRTETLGECSTYILRPHIFTGASMQNYLVGALRGTPTGKGKRGERLRASGKRLPLMLPFGRSYPEKRYQFVHVDDMARLLAHILHRDESSPETTILNVAARGEPITLARCAEIANAKVVRMPGRWACRFVLRLLWNLGISAIPPQALPYMIGSYTMDTTRLRKFLGRDYETVIRYTVEEALADSFRTESTQPQQMEMAGQPQG
ncbi:MAG TPA: NAD-dependent epimerase/dehydratase family protein [Clostridia bacterium]|nr:NAD-dependent epimerase/dehydratase family protein [Clostridia bacterium]